MFLFSHTFPVLWKSTFPMFWELYRFLLHPKYLRNPWVWDICFFPYFSRTMEMHFSLVLGIAWISASSDKFKTPLMFVFSHTYLVLWEFTFPMFSELHAFLLLANYVRNTWPWNVLFSHTFPVLLEITFPVFWGQYYWWQYSRRLLL